MSNIIDENGLQIDSLNELITNLEDGFKLIYGSDINVESNSPDGQIINIICQLNEDLLELLNSIYTSFDPDQAEGVVLDQRVAINNIRRQGATYSTLTVAVTSDRSLTLQGLDDAAEDPNGTGFTVSDNAGNQFILLDTTSFSGAETKNLSFRAKNQGAIQVAVGAVNIAITIILGITNVINAAGVTSQGSDGESDFALRERRKRSVALGSAGYLNGLEGALLNLDGVSDAIVYENFTDTTDSNSIPPHSIYAIVDGGSNEDIGNQIYSRKTAGCGMKGDVEVAIAETNNRVFTAKFDRPVGEALYIEFSIQELKPDQIFLPDAIKDLIVENLSFKIGAPAIAELIAEVAQDAIDSTSGANTGAVINLRVSLDGVSWEYFLEASDIKNRFSVSADNIDITIL